jgi:integrase
VINVYKHLLERFEKETKKEYFIKDIDDSFRLNFESYCTQQNYARNTITRAIKAIKTICYHAQANGIDISRQLSSIKVTWQKVEKVYLSLEELEKIEKKHLETESLNNAKDWLLISCETGQRVSDFMRFTKEQIRIENGKHLIEFTQVKTDKIMTVPLSKKVLAILKKRKGEFPRAISDQKYNEYIKDVCKLAGLTQIIKGSLIDKKTKRKKTGEFEKWELVSSHIGRRSFATNNYGHIPTSLLIGATGHSTEKMFLEYIGKSDTQKAIQLAEYF